MGKTFFSLAWYTYRVMVAVTKVHLWSPVMHFHRLGTTEALLTS